jgi:hypothetical protein
MASIYAWTEFFPADLQELTNFKVGPGDHMLVQVWMGNAGSKPTLAGAFGVCFLHNLSNGTYTYVYITPPAGTTFTGSSADWIMERPAVDGVLPDLSDYGAATMFNAEDRWDRGVFERQPLPAEGNDDGRCRCHPLVRDAR